MGLDIPWIVVSALGISWIDPGGCWTGLSRRWRTRPFITSVYHRVPDLPVKGFADERGCAVDGQTGGTAAAGGASGRPHGGHMERVLNPSCPSLPLVVDEPGLSFRAQRHDVNVVAGTSIAAGSLGLPCEGWCSRSAGARAGCWVRQCQIQLVWTPS